MGQRQLEQVVRFAKREKIVVNTRRTHIRVVAEVKEFAVVHFVRIPNRPRLHDVGNHQFLLLLREVEHDQHTVRQKYQLSHIQRIFNTLRRMLIWLGGMRV